MSIHPDMTQHPRAQPVRGPDGIIYPSQAEAARVFGVKPGTIFYHIDRYGDLSRLGTSSGTPVVWRGKRYTNAVQAANDAGVNSAAAYYQLRTHGNLDRLGIGRKGKERNRGKGKPVSVGGHDWPAVSLMARDLQVKERTLRNWLEPAASDEMRAKLRMAMAAYSDRLMAECMAAQARTFVKIGK